MKKLLMAALMTSAGHALAQTAPMETAPPPAPTTTPAPAEGCRPLTDKAMAADMRALTAQSQRADIAEQARFYAESVGLWTRAVALCEGRAKERAQRNLADNQRISAGLTEQLGAGPECAAAHKDGAALQELARSALGERRWSDASAFFRKAEDTWDLAVERCTGSQREMAIRRREQSEIDGYNAERCAPLFDRAREYTQKLRASAAGLAKEEKQDQLMIAETLWREALAQCKGSAAKDSASNNAQALARERGTQYVAKAPPAPPAPTTAVTPASGSAQSGTLTSKPATVAASPTPTAAANTATTLPPSANPGLTGSALASAFAAAFPTAARPAGATTVQAAIVKQPTQQPPDFMAGSTRFQGKFVADVEGHTFSGNGRISWANGDVYDGDLKNGQRHGKGQFTWANGNRYNGDWVNDTPRGTGTLQFANGNLYEGEVVDGTPQGKGRMAYASGDSYVGQFHAGVPQGQGLYVWKNGQQFEGDWANGTSHGQGRLKFASGDVFEGAVRNGVPQGLGTFTWTNGDKYVGQWQAGKKHGEGTFTWKSGDYWQGVYENDQQTANGRLVQKE
ncbi:MAG: hypothetical protein H7Y28_10210 [Rhodoferax sp.]|nr:hypothetical protein [Rhodoferax sp.]